MARINLTWEMGGEYGHVSRLLAFGEAFSARGHEVSYTLKDLSRAEALIGPTGAPCYQAPHWVPTITGLPDPVTSAETLIRFGYLETKGLTGICRAWQNLYALIKPDLIFCDFAPTALLAMRGRGIPTAVSDTGYGIPPARAPLPPYRWWLENGPPPLAGAEERVLESINRTAEALGGEPLTAVHEVFRGDETFLCSYRELDHYLDREDADYWGTVANLTQGEPPAWPSGKGPRVFVYLRPDYAGLHPLLQALNAAKARVLAFVPGLEEKSREALKSRRVKFSDHPVRMELVRAQCDAAVCHSGIGTAAAILTAGKPLLALPTHTEQAMVAMRIRRLRAGLVSDARDVVNNAPRLVEALLADPALQDGAKTFAKRYRGATQDDAVARIVTRCEALLETAPPVAIAGD